MSGTHRNARVALAITALMPGCALQVDQDPAAALEQSIIYGADSRLEYFEASATHRRWADSVAIVMDDLEVEDATGQVCDPTDATCTVLTSAYTTADPNGNGILDPLCSNATGAPASNYGAPSVRGIDRCTGFLVAPNIVATAAHCFDTNPHDGQITSEEPAIRCGLLAVVFGFQHEAASGPPTTQVPGSSVYHCAEVLDYGFGTPPRAVPDWALFRLDRNVTGRTPLFVRYTGTVAFDNALVAISHPSGVATKIDPGGAVTWNTPSESFFEANLDGFSGSSGAPVLNALTGVVEGIYSDGNRDYAWYSPGQCWTDHVCSELGCSNDKWEHISRITQASADIPLHAALVMTVL